MTEIDVFKYLKLLVEKHQKQIPRSTNPRHKLDREQAKAALEWLEDQLPAPVPQWIRADRIPCSTCDGIQPCTICGGQGTFSTATCKLCGASARVNDIYRDSLDRFVKYHETMCPPND